eukprot:scaffold20146_cov206-Isochrysis_galbana.AAC.2
MSTPWTASHPPPSPPPPSPPRHRPETNGSEAVHRRRRPRPELRLLASPDRLHGRQLVAELAPVPALPLAHVGAAALHHQLGAGRGRPDAGRPGDCVFPSGPAVSPDHGRGEALPRNLPLLPLGGRLVAEPDLEELSAGAQRLVRLHHLRPE